jgi:hypothetical protein
MNDEFVRVYDNGFHVVAEFRYVLIPFDGQGRPLSTFVLSEKYLRVRIENRKRYGLSVAEETKALSAIGRFKDGQKA